MLKLTNTLTNQKELFKPIKDKEVNMYVCGVTLYDDIHIGHLKSILTFEVLKNYFLTQNYHVNLVRNITDIDDKIIKKAIEQNKDPLALVNHYIDRYHSLLKEIEVEAPNQEPRVTQYLEKIEDYIKNLQNKGYAYQAEDGIYFDTEKVHLEKYPLSKKIVKDLEDNTRLEQNYDKKNKGDFALWKEDKEYGYHSHIFSKKGRPGWHIECSVMHQHTLGDKFDIHGGGRDLIFPHHENEILQSTAHNGHNPANYWIHNGMMTKDGKKLSKSLGNSIYVKDLLIKYNHYAIKLFLNKGQYNQSQEFAEQEIKEAYERWTQFVLESPNYTDTQKDLNNSSFINDINHIENTLWSKTIQALEDDLNTPLVMTYLYEALKEVNKNKSALLAQEILKVLKLLAVVPKAETLENLYEKEINKVPQNIKELINLRITAKNNKDFNQSDKLREEIHRLGWEVKDEKTGYKVYKK